MSEAKGRIALVTPWYGRELTGGAERQAYAIVHGLRERGFDVEVLTTRSRSFFDSWSKNDRAAGLSFEDGAPVRRFAVDRRNREAFDRANMALVNRPAALLRPGQRPVSAELEAAYLGEGIVSSGLAAFLEESREAYDAFIFIPYPHGLVVDGVRRVAERAILQPCLHDEAYAYLPAIEEAFHSAALLLFNGPQERDLALRLYGPGIEPKSVVAGQWIEHALEAPATRAGGLDLTAERYILYLGRRDAGKNLDLLLESFASFRRNEPMSELQLFLAGPGRTSFDDRRRGIVDLGLVGDAERDALLAHALAVLQPSLNESYSRVMMEAWAFGKPVTVSARCAATSNPVIASGGGWIAATKAEWTAVIARIDTASAAELAAAGASGRAYYDEHASRARVLDRYEAALERFARREPAALPVRATLEFWDDAGRGAYDMSFWDVAPHPDVMARLRDGKRNVLYAGLFDEGSSLEELLATFAFLLALGDNARLVLAGRFSPGTQLAQRMFELIGESRLTDRVLLLEDAPRSVSAACFRAADLFLSAADDPLSLVPLLDAMAFGIPIVAAATPRTREVLGPAGILYSKSSALDDAALVHVVLADAELRATLVAGQYARL